MLSAINPSPISWGCSDCSNWYIHFSPPFLVTISSTSALGPSADNTGWSGTFGGGSLPLSWQYFTTAENNLPVSMWTWEIPDSLHTSHKRSIASWITYALVDAEDWTKFHRTYVLKSYQLFLTLIFCEQSHKTNSLELDVWHGWGLQHMNGAIHNTLREEQLLVLSYICSHSGSSIHVIHTWQREVPQGRQSSKVEFSLYLDPRQINS